MIPGLVTVVIPVYNVEDYLDRCVQSVVNQTYKNLEIILVDDGSPDNCPAMCDAWAQKDSRIKVIHKENEGAGLARNTGIDNASGEYICFFDSDDYVVPELVEECYRVADEKQADIVRFGNIEIAQDGRIKSKRIPSSPKVFYEGKEIREKLIPRLVSYSAATGEDWNISLTFWGTMISTQLIQRTGWRIVSEREVFSEDFYSMFKLYQLAEKVAIIREAYYCYYTVNSKSLSHSCDRYNHRRINQMVSLMMKLATEYDCKVQAEIGTMYFGLTLGELKCIVACTEKFVKKWKRIKAIIGDDFLQRLLVDHDYTSEGFMKKTLFWTMKRKLTSLCYVLVVVRNLKG